MIPTLFGVTVVTFVIMQLAPGDPMLNQLTPGGGADKKGETRESYLLRMRDLKLDKPWLFNFRGFYSFKNDLLQAAKLRALSEEELTALLARMHKDPQNHTRIMQFVDNLGDKGRGIKNFRRDLGDPEKYSSLVRAIPAYSQNYFEKMGSAAVPGGMQLLESDELTTREKTALINLLNFMVVDKVQATYARDASESETPRVQSIWRLWWKRNQGEFEPLEAEKLAQLQGDLKKMAASSREDLFKMTERISGEDKPYLLPFLAGILLDDPKMLPAGRKASTLNEKVIAAMILKLFVARPLEMNANQSDSPEKIAEVIENWSDHYQRRSDEYQYSTGGSLWRVLADTQYAHMIWRLVTFDFGRSALKDRTPVREKLWTAFTVSAPLMIMSQLIIYLVAVPAGITCAVNRGNWIDTATSLGLFLLYSVPPFVAAMIFLLLFCYGDYLELFPMQRLHSSNAADMSWPAWFIDYMWHATLPVICLSLFSLAAIAMYARTSLLDVIEQDYIRTARAKGVSKFWVTYKHAFRNGMIPILTLFSNILPAMLGGSVLIEALFNIPGMGRLGWQAIEQQDYPTVMALVYVQAIVVLLTILLTDVLYVVVDPRISLEGKS